MASSPWCPWRQIGTGPIAFGLPVPAGTSRRLGALSSTEASRWLTWGLGRLGTGFLLRRGVAHNGANGPGERFEITIYRVVIGGVAALALASVEVVAIAIHALDELAQHTGVHAP